VVSWREDSYAGGDANPELRKRRRAALRLRSRQVALHVAELGSALAQPRMSPKALSYSKGSALEDIRQWTFAAKFSDVLSAFATVNGERACREASDGNSACGEAAHGDGAQS
jgi:hypothetical protein